MDRNLILALTFTATLQCLAQTPEPFEARRAEAVFEELPELQASEILKPEFLKGPHYAVRDQVPTGSGMNQFTIDSDFGVFEADGNEMLLQRLKEIDAIARLQDLGVRYVLVHKAFYQSDEYADLMEQILHRAELRPIGRYRDWLADTQIFELERAEESIDLSAPHNRH